MKELRDAMDDMKMSRREGLIAGLCGLFALGTRSVFSVPKPALVTEVPFPLEGRAVDAAFADFFETTGPNFFSVGTGDVLNEAHRQTYLLPKLFA